MEIQAGIHNEFDIIVRDAKTGEIKQTAKAYNILLNAFWTNFSSKNKFNNIHFGSGAATPVATDTALTTFVGGKACSTDSIDTSTFFTDGVIKRKRSIRLNDTEFVGNTISEVGFATGTSSGLLTKALVKDSNGNPLSITKNANEIIDIFGTFYLKVPVAFMGDNMYFDGSVGDYSILGYVLSSQTYNYIRVSYARGNIAPKSLSSISDLTKYDDTTALTPSWDAANKRYSLSFVNLVAGVANIGGFDSFYAGGLFVKVPCAGFAQPVLTKEVIATGDGTTKDFSCAFGSILNNGTTKLFANDVEVPATFDYNIPNLPSGSDIRGYLRILSSTGGVTIFENPYYQKVGVASVYGAYFNLYASNDQTTWDLVGSRTQTSNGTVAVSGTYQNYRYWKVTPYGAAQGAVIAGVTSTAANNKPIHATTAPATGSTVALSYQPNCIAKDANHVVNNMSLSITFNEYAP